MYCVTQSSNARISGKKTSFLFLKLSIGKRFPTFSDVVSRVLGTMKDHKISYNLAKREITQIR